MSQENKYDVFISYSRKDYDEVKAFVDMLKRSIPTLNVWFDIDGIESGDEFDEKIIDAIENSFCVLFALSDNSLQSQWTKDEVMYAKNMGIKVIPILLDGAKLKGWFLFKFGRIDYINSKNQKDVEKLIGNLSSWIKKTTDNVNIPPSTNITVSELENDAYHKAIDDKINIQQSQVDTTKKTWEKIATLAGGVAMGPLLGVVGAAVGGYTAYKGYLDNVIRSVIGEPKYNILVNEIPFTMIKVPGGTYKMGAISRQRVDAFDRELPIHEVTLSTYYIGETLVTQELWQAVMGSNPSYFNTDLKNPVEQVSWEDCQMFIQKLNQLTGKKFRLPTEAEWEFAARGGINSLGYKYSGSNQIKEVAWQQVPSEEGKTHPVGLRRPNELGVYDMSGNVWEWCNDWFGAYIVDELVNPHGPKTGNVRVCRGGCWHSHERYCCVFFRSFRAPHESTNFIGLRLVMEVNENE